MFIAASIASVLLALLLAFSAFGKLKRQPEQMEILTKVGVPSNRVSLLAAAEIAGAIGLIASLFWAPIGIAAGIGVVTYFVGAVTSHLRVQDKNISSATMVLIASAAVLTLRILAI